LFSYFSSSLNLLTYHPSPLYPNLPAHRLSPVSLTTTTTTEDRIRALHGQGISLSNIALEVYGYKDARTMGKVKQALGLPTLKVMGGEG
jgi:hypothetical protein